MKRNICIIPARGGSKRIPRKNIKYFLGKPIIAYSIEAAINSGLFDDIMVSTDDEEIAEIAKKIGAKVPFYRNKETANDFATTLDVIKEVVLEYKKDNIVFDNICCLYATAPFVTVKTLQKSYDKFSKNNYDSLFPVIPYDFPIQRSVKIENEKITFNYPEHTNTRSQDLKQNYHDAGQFYWLKSSIAENSDSIIASNTGAYIITELQGHDIDTEIDWKLAELKYEVLQSIK